MKTYKFAGLEWMPIPKGSLPADKKKNPIVKTVEGHTFIWTPWGVLTDCDCEKE